MTEVLSVRFSFVAVNGVTLHCAEAGRDDGPLLLLLHGFPEFWFVWREYFDPLAERGFSPRRARPAGLQSQQQAHRRGGLSS